MTLVSSSNAGTSTGSLMASMLAFGYTVDEVATVYEKFVPKLFTYSVFDSWRYCGNVFRSKYRSDNVVAAADALFAEHKYEVHVRYAALDCTAV